MIHTQKRLLNSANPNRAAQLAGSFQGFDKGQAPQPAARGEAGAVLIVSLILLLVLTMVVLSANREVVVQERMTSAIRESNLVFQAAESALVEAEDFINSGAGSLSMFSDSGTYSEGVSMAGLYSEGHGPTNYLDLVNTWAAAKTQVANVVSQGFSAKYFIEDLGEVVVKGQDISVGLSNNYSQPTVPPTARLFRIVVRAESGSGVVRLVSGYYSADLSES
ncbi:PilX N-terminal domain-containing pilus assembly protein [Halioxenophilus sp. WMMB6]|uniref:pilus assembly PilX family protein n=1 Tax=Halioxenophilus sp. WMMB6 TaxID=3073815 RepID=UPI00295EC7E4|nr:PilX N-terminal domain-containing pilus assembly protein [Halioxenophilus sp. WMMB6]